MKLITRIQQLLSFTFAIAISGYAIANPLALPNNFTSTSVIPAGCLTLTPSFVNVPNSVMFDNDIVITNAFGSDSRWRVRVWRIGCHEPGRSAIALNFSFIGGDRLLVTTPNIELSPLSAPTAPATAVLFPADVPGALQAGASALGILSTVADAFDADGLTFIVNTFQENLAVQNYNDDLVLRLSYISGTSVVDLDIPVPFYDPDLDPAQFQLPPLHGRYSGQWVVDGLPASGLLLQIGEVPGTDRNFVFAIWFTYIDGFPTWVVGNTDFEIGANEINLDMTFIEGGEFFTQPGSFTRDDIVASPVGTMTVRVNHCNEIEADVDFTEIGEGTANLTFNRLIRIAGYDCDQTQ